MLTRLAFVLLAVLALACSKGKDSNRADPSKTSDVTIKELKTDGYDRYEIELFSKDPTFKFPVQKFNRGAADIKFRVPAGEYVIRLDYFLKDKLVFGADLCADAKKNNTKTFVAGPNEVSLLVCSRTSSESGENQSAALTFSIKDGKLVDKSGKPFVMRGINVPHAYYFDKSYEALDKVKGFGFNTVRIVWCADTLLAYPDRCNDYHVRPVSDLEKVLKKMRQLKIVAVLNLQNATGSNKTDDLQQLVNYLIKPEVVQVLNDYRDMLLINMANEWYGDWDKSRTYIDAYKAMIPQLRKAGLTHTLVIDARGYGQDFSSVPEHAAELLKLDPNLIFSSHMYDVFASIEKVKESFATVRNQKIPFMIGEFACSHGDRGPVACDAIMSEAENFDYKVGTIAWSYTGNGSDLADLNLVDEQDWVTLSAFGKRIVESSLGVKATGKEACFFAATPCP